MGGKLFAAVSVCMLVTMGFCAPVKRRSGLYVCEGAGNPEDEEGQQAVSKWPEGIIPYSVSSEILAATRAILTQSMHYWENTSCVIFIPQTDQQDYVQFEPGNECCSSRGHMGHGMQAVILDTSCTSSIHSLNLIIKQLVGSDEHHHSNQTLGNTDTNLSELEVRGQHSSASTSNSEPAAPVPHELCNNTCGGYITLNPRDSLNTPQTITSPGYPGNYPPHYDCVWKLTAPEGYSISYTLKDIDIEEHSNCDYDFLDMFTLDKEGEIVQHRHLCGTERLNNDEAGARGTDTVVLRFHSDSTYNYRGFNLRYELKVSPTPCTMNSTYCDHYCSTDRHNGIVCSCREGYMLAEDGRSCQDVNECTVRKGGCDQRCRNTIGSFYCFCRPGYSLDANGRTCNSCEELHNSSLGIISSLGYSSPYPHYQNCLWTLTPWPGHHLRITIIHVDIVHTETCRTEYLKVEHGHFPYQRRLCGYYNDITYVVDKSTDIRFHSEDLNSQHSGFQIRYKQVPSHELSNIDLNYVIVKGRYIRYSRRLWVDPS